MVRSQSLLSLILRVTLNFSQLFHVLWLRLAHLDAQEFLHRIEPNVIMRIVAHTSIHKPFGNTLKMYEIIWFVETLMSSLPILCLLSSQYENLKRAIINSKVNWNCTLNSKQFDQNLIKMLIKTLNIWKLLMLYKKLLSISIIVVKRNSSINISAKEREGNFPFSQQCTSQKISYASYCNYTIFELSLCAFVARTTSPALYP